MTPNIEKNSLEAEIEAGLYKSYNNDIPSISANVGKSEEKYYIYEDALDIAGTGRYNISLLMTLSLVFMSMVVEMFGFSVLLTGCSCEFQLDMAQKSILASIPFVGPITMSFVWGFISDTGGRRRSLLIGTTTSFVVSMLASFSPNWIVFAVLKFVSASFSSSAQSATFALLGECSSQRVRSIYMLIVSASANVSPIFYFICGYYILPMDFFLSYSFLTLSPWRVLAIILSLPTGISALCLYFCHESPKFLTNQGREDEAVEVLRRIWIINGGDPDKYPVKKITVNKVQTFKREGSLLSTMWQQTSPLFQGTLLKRTLLLYYLTVMFYSTGSGFSMWYPLIADSFFGAFRSSEGQINGLCDLVVSGTKKSVIISNFTTNAVSSLFPTETCNSQLEDNSVYVVVVASVVYAVINMTISKLAQWRRLLLVTAISFQAISGIGLTLSPEPASAMVLFVIFWTTNLGTGLVSSYFVDLYPTSHRGMVACLSVVVARLSGLAGSNLVGAFIMSHCNTTFYAWSAFLFSGVAIAFMLPADRVPKKA